LEQTPSFKRELLATLPSLRAFAVSLSGRHDKADDLVQDTMMKAWAKQDSFQMGTNIKAWLFTILRNEFYSQMRKRGREVQDTDGAFTERMSVHPSQYGVLDMADFKKALDSLPPDVGARIRGLQDYDFLEPSARERFDELVRRLQRQVLDQYVAGLSEAIQGITPEDLAANREVTDLVGFDAQFPQATTGFDLHDADDDGERVAGDADGNVELGRHDLPGLTDLKVVGPEA